MMYTGKYIDKNWNKYRCKIYMAPFAGLVKPEKGKNVVEIGAKNVMNCLWVQIKQFFLQLIKPFNYIISIIHKIIDSVKETLNKFRQQLGIIRKLLLKIAMSVMERIENLGASFVSEFLKIRDILKRSTASFQTLIYTIETLGITMKNMMDGPVGNMAKLAEVLGQIFTFFLLGPLSVSLFPSLWFCACFSEDTKVKLSNNCFKNIKDVSIGDNLKDDYVEGILVFKNKNRDIFYKLDDDYATETHLVKYNDTWIPIIKHPKSTLTNIIDNYLYCLCTKNNTIPTKDNVYTDWNISNNKEKWIDEKVLILNYLNNKELTLYDNKHCYQEGFAMYDFKSIQSLKLELLASKDIWGIGIWKNNNTIKWYKHINNDTVCTGSTIIYENSKWIPVYLSKNHIKESVNIPKYIVNYITIKGTISKDKVIYRDLLETHDNEILNKYNVIF